MPDLADQPRYSPKIFDARTVEEARAVVLSADETAQVDERWRVETPWFGSLIGHACALGPNARVLDFGCGLGRLAKWLIENIGCRVVGVDISPAMRTLAAEYVASPLFSVVSYDDFRADPTVGGGFDAAYAC